MMGCLCSSVVGVVSAYQTPSIVIMKLEKKTKINNFKTIAIEGFTSCYHVLTGKINFTLGRWIPPARNKIARTIWTRFGFRAWENNNTAHRRCRIRVYYMICTTTSRTTMCQKPNRSLRSVNNGQNAHVFIII